ncbi:hypothetical protein BJY04DRAFT_176680 [Aspergillus karnatakaensis]|uniref:uncharacterized protein n=1 Tax=Aspergillus karnatakaensis TaxID=1810916 RepID=UPI003CCCCD1E
MCEVARTHPDSREASFGFLPPTLSTYLVNDILLRSPEVRDRSNARLQGQNGAELLRYKIRVVRDSFLWLSDLVERRSDWVDLIVSETHTMTQDLVGARLIWLSGTQTREFCERPTTANVITEDGRSALENLWQMFDGNEEAPIRIAFSLAKLDAKGRWSDAWGRLNEVNRLLW